MGAEIVILDCYTDEPSGYGVRPYLGSHQIHLSQALAALGEPHYYLTIDDLRYAERVERGETLPNADDLLLRNSTVNRECALERLEEASTVYVVMGCFVEYQYFSCTPPRSAEVAHFLRRARGRKVLFYVMGVAGGVSPDFSTSELASVLDDVEYGNAYRYIQGNSVGQDLLAPDYALLDRIGQITPPVLNQLTRPVIAEIETGTGCNTPTCTFCIEAERSPRVQYRAAAEIVKQVRALYDGGVRHFRLGRQPNFFHYQRQKVASMEALLEGIRTECPDLRMLHIDNVNIINVVTPAGREIARLVSKYCTSGNVAPFGIESFDPDVRQATRVVGSAEDVFRAVEIINEFGAARGEDGLPRLLPGINLIHGLPGSSSKTHEANLRWLERILNSGLMTYRFYYRSVTQPTGVSFQERSEVADGFEEAFSELKERYVVPMQDRVYPSGTRILGDWESVPSSGGMQVRTLGTCSIKVLLPREKHLPPDLRDMTVQVNSSLGYRLLEGQVAR